MPPIAPVGFGDQILPVQGPLNQLYTGDEEDYYKRLAKFVHGNTSAGIAESDFDLRTPERFSYEDLGSDPVTLSFLEFLITCAGYRNILEIGTFIGVSAMRMARAAGANAQVVTIEKGEEFEVCAKGNIDRNGYSDRVEVQRGEVLDLVPQMDLFGRFDLVYLDGGKDRYGDYFPILMDSLRAGGVLIADDVLFHGDVLNDSPSTDKGDGVVDLCHRVTQAGLNRVLLPFSNGMLLVRKP